MTGRAVNRSARILVIGGGYTGQRFAAAAAALGARVWLTHRNAEPPHTAAALSWLRFDPANGVPLAMPEAISHALVTIPAASDGSDAALDHLLPELRHQPLDWLGYLSTTGVYGDTGGAWVDETSPTTPSLDRSRARLACEQRWLNSGLPAMSFRLPAIYGPGRSPFAALLEGRARLIHKPGQVFSRIHVDDIVGALLHCLSLPAEERPTLLNLADAEPCPSSETLGYAAHLLDHKLPPVERFADVADSMSPMARSFWMENRRTDSQRLQVELGYPLRYPSYREGYREGCAEDWTAERLRTGRAG